MTGLRGGRDARLEPLSLSDSEGPKQLRSTNRPKRNLSAPKPRSLSYALMASVGIALEGRGVKCKLLIRKCKLKIARAGERLPFEAPPYSASYSCFTHLWARSIGVKEGFLMGRTQTVRVAS